MRRAVLSRRVRVLSEALAVYVPNGASLLNVGCGDGRIAAAIAKHRKDVSVRGVDVLVRQKTWFPVEPFDGRHLPYEDKTFDVVTFINVLHHTADPTVLLNESRRVARQAVILKDHTRNGLFASATLRFMDRVGNAHYGVALPYNYWSFAQ